MGPRPEDRGKLSRGGGEMLLKLAFNGATTRRSWKTAARKTRNARRPALQWGHDPKIVENSTAATRCHTPSILQWGHDPKIVENHVGRVDGSCDSGPSMGPRPEDRGKRRVRAYGCGLCGGLQWGHDPKIVENGSSRTLAGAQTLAFNGATTRRSWKTIGRKLGTPFNSRPSMGPRPEDRGKLRTMIRPCMMTWTFNGATTRRSWKTGN